MKISFVSADAESVRQSEVFLEKYLGVLKNNALDDGLLATCLEHVYNVLSNSKDEASINSALAYICHTADALPRDKMVRQLLADSIAASRNFLYSDMLAKRYGEEWTFPCVFDNFQKEFYRTSTGTLLTKQQYELLEAFRKNQKLIVSAPTSFGKTRLLQEIILEKSYQRVAVIMPTIALIAETVRRFREDPRFDDFAVINAMSLPLGAEKFIFVLTPEKLDLLLDGNPELGFDFFAMDEIYKIQDDEDRKAVFAHVLYRMARSTSAFYLIGPYFKAFSERFIVKTQSAFKHFGVEIVQKEEIRLYDSSLSKILIDGEEVKKAKGSLVNLKRITSALKEQQLIYNNTRRGTETIAKHLSKLNAVENRDSAIVGYIEENISKGWTLVECLRRGVAFHHGAMPRYIQTEIVEAFNRNEIKTLVCTSTLTEGVNTTAKNVIVYSNQKADKALTGFECKNIKGRAGRFLHHFVGRVISFQPTPEEEKDIISFYYFDEPNLNSDEVLNIEEKDLLPAARVKRNAIIESLGKNSIPLNIIRENKYISVDKQVAVIQKLRSSRDLRESMKFYTNIPNGDYFDRIFDLIHEYLFSTKDAENHIFTRDNLRRLVKFYIYKKPSIKQLIDAQGGAHVDTKIRRAFNLISHFFEFSLPKYLSCFQNLYNFVMKEYQSDYEMRLGFVVTLLQYGYTSPHEIALKDAGLPDEVIDKLSPKLADCRTFEEIRARMQFEPNLFDVLTEFEANMIKRLI